MMAEVSFPCQRVIIAHTPDRSTDTQHAVEPRGGHPRHCSKGLRADLGGKYQGVSAI
jgi:hypothetical protein